MKQHNRTSGSIPLVLHGLYTQFQIDEPWGTIYGTGSVTARTGILWGAGLTKRESRVLEMSILTGSPD